MNICNINIFILILNYIVIIVIVVVVISPMTGCDHRFTAHLTT